MKVSNTLNSGDLVGYLLLKDRYITGKKSHAYWNCKCTLCGSEKAIREDSLKSGKVISDGCYQKSEVFSEKQKKIHQIEDLTGNIYGELKVLHLAEQRQGKHIMWTCLCSCGKITDVWSANLKNGNSKTCGDFNAHRKTNLEKVWNQNLDDLTGKQFGDWIVKEKDRNSILTKWICECQNCGTVKSVFANALKTWQSTSCGCKKYKESLTNMKIGHWLVGEKSRRKRPNEHYCATYFCTCDCGTQRYVDSSRLKNRTSLSCGCVKSRANEYIASVLKENGILYTPEYKFEDLFGPNNGFLRFDFAIHDQFGNVICLLEYQGEQHYRNDIEFGKQQREITDKAKKRYCKQKQIPLFEIKYTDDIDVKLNRILSHIAC